jgi:hypothetical protein
MTIINSLRGIMERWETRITDLHIEKVEGSVVIYDALDDSVHYLTDDTLRVYSACPGSVEDIAESTGLPEDHVAAHLNELESRALVLVHSAGSASRRSLVVGSTLAVLGIWSMSAPTPAAASSTTPDDGGGGGGGVIPVYYFTGGMLFSQSKRQGIILKTPLAPGTGTVTAAGNYEYYASYDTYVGSYWDLTMDGFSWPSQPDSLDQAWVDYYRTNNLALPTMGPSNYPDFP